MRVRLRFIHKNDIRIAVRPQVKFERGGACTLSSNDYSKNWRDNALEKNTSNLFIRNTLLDNIELMKQI